MKKTLIVVLIVVAVILAGILVWQNWQKIALLVNNQLKKNGQSKDCLKEGEINSMGYNSSEESLSCCSGLRAIPAPEAWRNPDGSIDSTCNPDKLGVPYNVVCAYCGDGVCGTGENKCNCAQDCQTKPTQLNDEIIKQMAKEKWGDCADKCTNFSVNVNYNADIPYATVTYDGLYDDSIKTEIIGFSFTFDLGEDRWVIDESTVSKGWICHPGRGHQTASQEPCI